mmetsp:Transcript_4851/g.6565  ORF Transcript_4851/g.6565 Transcript_4851/m.6565 type:complete len:351 (-) Transcript_4851:120-1172(-)
MKRKWSNSFCVVKTVLFLPHVILFMLFSTICIHQILAGNNESQKSFETTQPQVAVCIAGQTRLFVHEEVRVHIFNRMVKPIREQADVFFVLNNLDSPNLDDAGKSLAEKLFEPVVSIWHLGRGVGHSHQSNGCRRTHGFTMTLGVSLCGDTVFKYEQNNRNGVLYKWVLRLRTDNMYHGKISPFLNWPLVDNLPVVFVEYLGGCWTKPGIDWNVSDTGFDNRVCAKSDWALVSRAASQAYYVQWRQAYIDCSFGEVLQREHFACSECILGAHLANQQVYKRVPIWVLNGENMGDHVCIVRKEKYHTFVKSHPDYRFSMENDGESLGITRSCDGLRLVNNEEPIPELVFEV